MTPILIYLFTTASTRLLKGRAPFYLFRPRNTLCGISSFREEFLDDTVESLSLVVDPKTFPLPPVVRLPTGADQATRSIDYEESDMPANLSPASQTLSSSWPEDSFQNAIASQISLPASDANHAPDETPFDGGASEMNIEDKDTSFLAQEYSDTVKKSVHMLAEQVSHRVADKIKTLEHQLREKTMVVFSLNTQLGLAGVANRALRRNIDQLSAIEAENRALRLQNDKLEVVNHTLKSEVMKLQTERRDFAKVFSKFTLQQDTTSDSAPST